jgi:hypothetical protein
LANGLLGSGISLGAILAFSPGLSGNGTLSGLGRLVAVVEIFKVGFPPGRPAVPVVAAAALSLALTGLNDGKGAFRRILAAPAITAVALDAAGAVVPAVVEVAPEVIGLFVRAGGFVTAAATGALGFASGLLSGLAFGTAGLCVSFGGLEVVEAEFVDAAETDRAMTAGAVLPFPETPIGGGFIFFALTDGFVAAGREAGARATCDGRGGVGFAVGAAAVFVLVTASAFTSLSEPTRTVATGADGTGGLVAALLAPEVGLNGFRSFAGRRTMGGRAGLRGKAALRAAVDAVVAVRLCPVRETTRGRGGASFGYGAGGGRRGAAVVAGSGSSSGIVMVDLAGEEGSGTSLAAS